MARVLLLVVGVLIACAEGARAGSEFLAEDNPIRQVVDGLHELESSILQIVGNSRRAFSFARFVHKYGKRYDNSEEIQRRFEIFSENLRMIRSHNKKGLSYTMGVNERLEETGIVSPLKIKVIADLAGHSAFEYIKYNGGLDTENAYPYTGKNGDCKYSSENVGVQVLDSVNITLGAEDELKHAVAFSRPVSVAFQVVSGFRAYKSGVYTSTTCGSSPMDVNHAVLAVGYGVENGIPYWLIKNSWGADWGDNGYFKMEMGKNMCGVSTCASYPVVA
ncbi:hypothetical protein DH2020_026576 [Rehmannia glutinosa]|uniref:Cysteine proteinase n=1 Tax=Rehmannia glutinosa TaxID=99300 RepID=A0ABR0VWK2_REHGL